MEWKSYVILHRGHACVKMHVLKHKPVSVSYEIEVLELTLY